jgi:hypothetical protein
MSADAKANQYPVRPPRLQIEVSQVAKLSMTVAAAPPQVSSVDELDDALLVDVVVRVLVEITVLVAVMVLVAVVVLLVALVVTELDEVLVVAVDALADVV